MRPVELHFWPTPNGWKATVMLEELGVPYEIRWVNIGKGEQFHPDFLAIAPNNRMPAIVDPDGPGGEPVSVFESGAILLYLARKHGRFYPTDERRRIACEEWLMWQMGGLGPMLGQAHHFRLYAPEPIPYAVGRYTEEAARLYGVMDRRLEGRDWLAEEYSIADMACVGWIARHERHGIDLSDHPNVKAWWERMNARPAVARGLAVGVERQASPTDRSANAGMFAGGGDDARARGDADDKAGGAA